MAGRRKFYSAREVIEYICLPDGALSDTESIPDDKIADPDFEESPEAYESDSSFDDDKPLAAIPKANLNHLDVEIHNIHADSDTEVPDDNEPQPGPAPVNKEFSWRQRKPPAADIDSSFRGPAFSPPPDEIPSPKWYFDQFMDKSVFEHISNQSNFTYAIIPHVLADGNPLRPNCDSHGAWRFDNLRTYIHMNDNTNVKQRVSLDTIHYSSFLFPNPGFLFPNPGFLFPNPGFLFPNPGFLFPNPRFLCLNTGFLFPNPGFLFPNTGFLFPNPDFLFSNPCFLFPNPGFLFSNLGLLLPNPDFLFSNPRFLFPNPGFLFPNLGFLLPNPDFLFPNPCFLFPNPRLPVA
ncbi:hypothetical protein HF521_003445 [Silurus meridionalis]|uniref:Uncharacterized protein n=1 Tax=Silurus meridionalis TaxID=175797 RepID=A0A8T0AYD1_SILME|nr:hypothetical protein HF521_003445 [Silurus meridionalis]